jgi:hypothetical protein
VKNMPGPIPQSELSVPGAQLMLYVVVPEPWKFSWLAQLLPIIADLHEPLR